MKLAYQSLNSKEWLQKGYQLPNLIFLILLSTLNENQYGYILVLAIYSALSWQTYNNDYLTRNYLAKVLLLPKALTMKS